MYDNGDGALVRDRDVTDIYPPPYVYYHSAIGILGRINKKKLRASVLPEMTLPAGTVLTDKCVPRGRIQYPEGSPLLLYRDRPSDL